MSVVIGDQYNNRVNRTARGVMDLFSGKHEHNHDQQNSAVGNIFEIFEL